ncbi:NACHT, LRR and PYD domains-containing protein 3-like [Hemitrygon akajei]|uniref:NACHT, LRR and PYD domains-containing protein 3-like n=1 Tax=Hemitrygon akajei TaxID=2704970 RepID=UPI003BFA2D96
MQESTERGQDLVTSTTRSHTGGKLTRIRKFFKRLLPSGSSRRDDQASGITTTEQSAIKESCLVESLLATGREEQGQHENSVVRDGDQAAADSPREATPPLRDSLMREMSSFDQDPTFQLVRQWDDYQLFQLTNFHRERLKQAIEEGVEGLAMMLRQKGHFSGQEQEKVRELAEKGNRTESCTLFLNLVTEKTLQARRVMWESFVKMRNRILKLDQALNKIQEMGPNPHEYMNIAQGLSELSAQLKDVQEKHKETLRAQTETLRVNTMLMREKVKGFLLVDHCAELTVISTVQGQKLVEHELLAKGRDHEQWGQKLLRGELEKFQIDELFRSSISQSESKSGISASVAGVAGIGKTTMMKKIVCDWTMGKIYQQFQFVFSFKFRDLNSINCRINLRELIQDQYPYFRNILGEIWKNPEGLLFIFDGLDEFKHRIDFADNQRHTEPQHVCTDPEDWCEVSDIVYSLIQHKLLPGCSVLVTTRTAMLHLLEKAEISVWVEILGFIGDEQKEYFNRFFEDSAMAAAVLKHMEENEILYTMSYNPSYCLILSLALGSFLTQRDRDTVQLPKTITQLYSHYIYNILKHCSCEIESPRDVLLRVGQMAFAGVSEGKIVFTDEDLIKYNLQPSQFLLELLEREDCARNVVYTFPHLTIQEFVAALAQFLNPDCGGILKLFTEAHSKADGRYDIVLRFVAGLSSPESARGLEEFLGPFARQTTCRVIDWMKGEIKRQNENSRSVVRKRTLLNTLHYVFESQSSGLAQATLGSVERLSFCGLLLTPVDCAVLSHVIGFCDTIKHLDLECCYIECEGLQRLGPELHKCQELGLDNNKLGDSGVKLVCATLKNPECKIQKLLLRANGLTHFCTLDLASALSASRSLTKLDLGGNKLGDSGVELLTEALKYPECKIEKLWLGANGLTDSCMENFVSALITIPSLTDLSLRSNCFTDQSIPAFQHLILTCRNLERIWLERNAFSCAGALQLESLQRSRSKLSVEV